MNKLVKDYFFILVGSFMFCAGLNLFIVPMGLYNGGTVGIAQIIRTLLETYGGMTFQIDIAGLINFVINIPLLWLAYRHFGKSLFLKTVFSVVTQTIFFVLIPVVKTPILDEFVASCLIGGLIAGCGVGMTLRFGGTGGGADVLGLYFTQKIKGFSVGKLVLILNSCIYLTCAFLFELPIAIYSIIYSAVYSLTVDKTHIQNINDSVMIFTKKKDLHQAIIQELHRGVTYWKGIGGYTEEDTYVLVCALSKYEIAQLSSFLSKADPNAFVLVSEGHQVMGNYEVRL